jgi:hypothetical protein
MSRDEPSDKSRVLPTAMTAVLLVLAGLGLMAWGQRAQFNARAPLAFLQLR